MLVIALPRAQQQYIYRDRYIHLYIYDSDSAVFHIVTIPSSHLIANHNTIKHIRIRKAPHIEAHCTYHVKGSGPYIRTDNHIPIKGI